MAQSPQLASSPLLALLQLGSDTFSEVLLPKLCADGSADNVALTCRELRDLCHSSVQELNFSKLDTSLDINTVLGWMQQLPQHFAGCTRIQLLLDDDTDSGIVPVLWNGIGRLHHLKDLQLHVKANDSLASKLLAVALPHLPTLRSLVLQLESSWVNQHTAWKAMGQATQLTHLEIGWPDKETLPCTVDNLQHLTSLRDLNLLCLAGWNASPPTARQQQQQQRVQIPGCFTALRTMLAPLYLLQDISSISRCVELQALALYRRAEVVDGEAGLAAADWAAVATVTALQYLKADERQGSATAAARRAAVAKLKQLHLISGTCWQHNMLPVFQELTCLTGLEGSWQQRGKNSPKAVCPQMKALSMVGGDVPFAAFPNITELCFGDPIDDGCWAEMVDSCKKLQAITVFSSYPEGSDRPHFKPHFMFVDSLPEAKRVANIQLLSSLTQLTSLQLSIGLDSEMAAFASVADGLVKHGLQHADVVLMCSTCHVSALGLVQFGRVVQLPQLDVCVQNPSALSLASEDAHMVLSALRPTACALQLPQCCTTADAAVCA